MSIKKSGVKGVQNAQETKPLMNYLLRFVGLFAAMM
jgi:hypothetical protein